ncbi:MAG: MarR family transcriptional regulator [Clostridia bacterium]|nr:MarR family transcriptional regulator [Clostridia bacterium]
MLSDEVKALYNKSRLMHYRTIFGHIREKDGSLSATEAFAADVICLLGSPTIKQFSDYIGISQPNATYKINNLIAKGYIEKIPSEGDKRETRVRVCNKYFAYSGEQDGFIDEAVEILKAKSTPGELETFEKMLRRLGDAVDKK